MLTPGETDELFTIMRQLKAGGRSIIFISHKLREVQAIADVITVIRRGKVMGQRPPTATDAELLPLPPSSADRRKAVPEGGLVPVLELSVTTWLSLAVPPAPPANSWPVFSAGARPVAGGKRLAP